MPTTETSKKLGFRPDVQGLRAIAVILVVVYHSEVAFSGGFLGVDMFFVISGFVIGRLLIQELNTTGTVKLSEFYSRRVRRILPAMAVLLVFVAIGSMVFLGPSSGLQVSTLKVGIASVFYGANFVLAAIFNKGYFDVGAGNHPLLHLWTLSVEEQFYIFFPPFLIVLTRLTRRFKGGLQGRTARRFIVGSVIAAAVVSFIGAMLLVYSNNLPVLRIDQRQTLAFFSSATRAWEFLAGVLLVWVERAGLPWPRWLRSVGATLGLFAIIAVSWFASGSNPTPGWVALYVVVATAAVIAVGPEANWTSKLLGTRVAQFLGDRSYGWYLWHWPAIVFTRLSFPKVSPWILLFVGVATLVPTELSYRYIEQPIRLNRSWRGWRAVKLAAICCLAPIITLFAVHGLNRAVGSRFALPDEALALHLDKTVGCNKLYPDNPKVEQDCTWTTPESKGRIVLIGDSQAGAISEVVRDRSLAAGYDFTLTTYSSCPFADVIRQDGRLDKCHDWVTAWTEELATNPPSQVVIASLSSNYVWASKVKLKDPITGVSSNDEGQKKETWEAGLRRTLERIETSDTPVVVVHTVPLLDEFDLRLCPAWRVALDRATGCSVTTARDMVESQRQAAVQAEKNAAVGLDNVHLVDFIDDLCTDKTCIGYRDGLWVYRDDRHLSVVAAASLGPVIDADILSRAETTSG